MQILLRNELLRSQTVVTELDIVVGDVDVSLHLN